MVRSEKRFELVDMLRGLAALSVVLFHYVGFLPLHGVETGAAGNVLVTATRFGHLGVPVFFVISGFVIALTADRVWMSFRGAARFVTRRMVRIAPPYWFMIAAIVMAHVAGKPVGLYRQSTITAPQVLAHVFYLQELLAFPPLDVVYWTLCLEVQFYLVFAASAAIVTWLFPGRHTGVLSFWLVASAAGSLLADWTASVPQGLFVRLWYQFAAGAVAFHASHGRLPIWAVFGGLGVLTASAVARESASDAVTATTALLLGRYGLRLGPVRIPFRTAALALGSVSYSLYLSHGFVGSFSHGLFRRGFGSGELGAWMLVGGSLIAALIFAAGLYLVCERRAINLSRRVRLEPLPEPICDTARPQLETLDPIVKT